jgi:serine/threonine protein kinase
MGNRHIRKMKTREAKKFSFGNENNQNNIIEKDNNNSLVVINDYKFLKNIGKGNYSNIILAIKDQSKYAIKLLRDDKVKNKYCIEIFEREIEILNMLEHKYIVKIFDSFKIDDNLFIVLEYHPYNDLFYYLKSGKLNEKHVKVIMAQVYLILKYLHSNGILYRDLKPENILFDSEGNVKLIDFGLALKNVTNESKITEICGTSEYIPPEVIKGESYNFDFDWWTFGILMYELLSGHVIISLILATF